MSTEKYIQKLEAEIKELQSSLEEVRSDIGRKAKKVRRQAEDKYEDFKDEAADAWEDAQDQGEELFEKTRRGAKRAYYNTIDYTQEHPWRVTGSVLAFVGIAGLICYLVSERSDSQLRYLKRRYHDFF